MRMRTAFAALATTAALPFLGGPLLVGTAHAQLAGSESDFANPPKLMLQAPPKGAAKATEREKYFDLHVAMTEHVIRNPMTKRLDKVSLRSYVGPGVDPKAPFVAPMVEAVPGDTVRMTLHNDLPKDESCLVTPSGGVNDPHCFNGTNMHSHGLWISPTGNSDNVLLSINPGAPPFQYEYNIPSDHPSGTFWYHTHRHGSTALQVSSGMAGALIIRGDRAPTPTRTGDIDTLLKAPKGGKPIAENTLMMQQIQYACYADGGNIKVQLEDGTITVKDTSGNQKIKSWYCDKGDVGGVNYYDAPNGASAFGPGTWNESGRYTTINGLVRPRFKATAGEMERWRLIHGGVRDTITFEIRRHIDGAPDTTGLTEAEADDYINTHCTGEPLKYLVIASDGLTMDRAQVRTTSTLQPGYRNDLLIEFPEAGNYCVVNESAPASGNLSRRPVSRRLLGTVKVTGKTKVPDVVAHMTTQLVAMAKANMPKDVRAAVVKDLENGLKLSAFVPHETIADGELTGKQELSFNIDTANTPALFEVGNSLDPSKAEPYSPDRVDRHLPLGGVEEWTMVSGLASHPFHIHVNPFQIVAIYDPNGKDVSVDDPKVVDDFGGTVDPQYHGLKGVWKDTLWVKNAGGTFPAGAYKIVVRTRYQRYIGEFVLHCHILDHEDQGMMQNISIDLPDGSGGTSKGHH